MEATQEEQPLGPRQVPRPGAPVNALSTVGSRRRAGFLALAGFAAFLFNFLEVNIWIPGLHSYAGA